MRDLPKNIRGLIIGLIAFTARMGDACFGLVAGYVNDNISNSAPFGVVAMIGFVYFIAVLLAVCCGKFNI